jgi:hypothetical protein
LETKSHYGEKLFALFHSKKRSNKVKSLFIYLLVLAVVPVFYNSSWAVCPQDPIDLGICDTLYVETFDYDYNYNATAGYDSVRVAIYATHDSNTFYWEGGGRWVQDSIRGIMVPLEWWNSGCVDSVVLPTYDNWNNKVVNRADPKFNRSIFRDLVDTHIGDTVYNRYAHVVNELGWQTWTVNTHFKGDSAYFAMMASSGFGKWWEGEKVLVATLTFLVYMPEGCGRTTVCLDTLFSPIEEDVSFTRYDAIPYMPRFFFPVCDAIYLSGDANEDGLTNSADVTFLINYLFVNGPAPDPLEAGDVNCDGDVNSADVVYLINYLFVSGPPPGC